jgi:short-subunit dehydrogenase
MSKSKTIVITGAAKGIGYNTAVTLAKRGHKVVATTHNKEQADAINSNFDSINFDLSAFKLDITNNDDRAKLATVEHDVLICNAGIGESGSLAEIDMNRVRNNFEVNVFATFEIAQVSLKQFIEKGRGTVLFISSLAGRIGMPWLAPYSMTKFALTCGAEQLRDEMHLLNKNIHVSVIEPGGFHTGFNQQNMARKYEWMNNGYFKEHIEKIKEEEERQFNFVEVKTTDIIVKKIVKAAEARKPSLRYSAPTWQAWGTQVLRMFGK